MPALSCAPANVQVSVLKTAEDGQGLIVRLVEMHGKRAQATLRLYKPILAAEEVSLAEEPLAGAEEIAVSNGMARIAINPYEIKTIRISVG
jgi:alpha-mannosidase